MDEFSWMNKVRAGGFLDRRGFLDNAMALAHSLSRSSNKTKFNKCPASEVRR